MATSNVCDIVDKSGRIFIVNPVGWPIGGSDDGCFTMGEVDLNTYYFSQLPRVYGRACKVLPSSYQYTSVRIIRPVPSVYLVFTCNKLVDTMSGVSQVSVPMMTSGFAESMSVCKSATLFLIL